MVIYIDKPYELDDILDFFTAFFIVKICISNEDKTQRLINF